MKKKLITLTFVMMLLALGLLAGCRKKAPDSLTITVDGEAVKSLDILNGQEQTGVTVVIGPEDFKGEVTWSSEDSGIVKLENINGNECTLITKKTGKTRIQAECNGVTATLSVHVRRDFDNLTAREIALTVNDTAYSLESCNMYFVKVYNEFTNYYGEYASYYGLDTSSGITGLKSQSCDYSSDGTWYGYFLESAVEQIAQVQELVEYADEIGVTLDDADREEIESRIDDLSVLAERYKFDTVNDYLEACYGSEVTTELYRRFLENEAIANKVYNVFVDNLSFTEEEINEHYIELGYDADENNYRVTSMRHILIKAEADETGTITDEAIEAAHARAEEIYEEWKAGECTEDSFAELANAYTDDSGSNTTGGLYTEIYNGQMITGINDWLFNEEHEVGDTVIVDNNGSYVGTHIVYFAGYGDTYKALISRSDLEQNAVTDWFSTLSLQYTTAEGEAYSSIGVFN